MSVSLSSMPNGGSPVRLPNIGLRGGSGNQASECQASNSEVDHQDFLNRTDPPLVQITLLPVPPERQPVRDCGPTNGRSWVPCWTVCRTE